MAPKDCLNLFLETNPAVLTLGLPGPIYTKYYIAQLCSNLVVMHMHQITRKDRC